VTDQSLNDQTLGGTANTMRVRMNFGEANFVTCNAKIVRRQNAKGIYPAGIGVKFTDLPFAQRRALRQALAEF
jgi:hypothetical protein